MTTTNNDLEALDELQKQIKITFNDIGKLKHALIHRSYINENEDKGLANNERLEYLGDAVLELIVTEYLFNKYVDRAEGDLTSFRAATVNTVSLAETAKSINLGKYIYMSHGEEITGGRERPYILANTFEALLGAIFIDQGLDICKGFLMCFLLPKIEKIVTERLDIDSKSKLQEMCQDRFNVTPTYELISSIGPDHAKIFTMGLKIDRKIVAQGQGKNKQEAEQKAAHEAIINWDIISRG